MAPFLALESRLQGRDGVWRCWWCQDPLLKAASRGVPSGGVGDWAASLLAPGHTLWLFHVSDHPTGMSWLFWSAISVPPKAGWGERLPCKRLRSVAGRPLPFMLRRIFVSVFFPVLLSDGDGERRQVKTWGKGTWGLPKLGVSPGHWPGPSLVPQMFILVKSQPQCLRVQVPLGTGSLKR